MFIFPLLPKDTLLGVGLYGPHLVVMASYRRPAVILVSLGAVRVFPLASSEQTFTVCLNRTCLDVGVLMFNLSVL